MAEPAIKYETQEVETKAVTIVDQAKAVKVTDARTYEAAGHLYKSIGEMIKEVKDTFDPICDAANKAHKAATAKRAQYLDPLQDAYKSVKGLMSAWDQEQERLRLAEQRRLEEIARKEAEERALQEAIAAEEEAKRNGATQEEAEQEAAAIIDEPVYVPPVEVQKTVPKVQGIVYRETWSAECFDIKALCKGVAEGRVSPECVMPNMPVLNKLATGLKSTMAVPGCRAISRRV
jgi:Fe2+ transport system protein B